MRLLLLLTLLTTVASAQEYHELEVKGRLTCPPHITADIWSFKVVLVRQPKFATSPDFRVVDNKTVTELQPFSLQSPAISPFKEPARYDYFLHIDSVHGCSAPRKTIALDLSKHNIDLGVVDLTKI